MMRNLSATVCLIQVLLLMVDHSVGLAAPPSATSDAAGATTTSEVSSPAGPPTTPSTTQHLPGGTDSLGADNGMPGSDGEETGTTLGPEATTVDDCGNIFIDLGSQDAVVWDPGDRNVLQTGSGDVRGNCQSTWTTSPSRKPGSPLPLEMFLGVSVPLCSKYSCGYQCSCDVNSCLMYGDCCYETLNNIIGKLPRTSEYTGDNFTFLNDVEHVYEMVQLQEFYTKVKSERDHMRCVTNIYSQGKQGYWMISVCPESFTGDTAIKDKCEDGLTFSVDDVPTEMELSVGEHRVFRNMYCAICHGTDFKDVSFWHVRANCPVFVEGKTTLEEVRNSCAVTIFPSTERRRCFSGVIEDCASNDEQYPSEDVVALCNRYTYPVRADLIGGEALYKNPHCALCKLGDIASTKSLNCTSSDEGKLAPGSQDLRLLFDFRSGTGVTMNTECDNSIECPINEVFDCIRKKCIPLYCQAGYTAEFGTCVLTNSSHPSYSLPADSSGLHVDEIAFTFTMSMAKGTGDPSGYYRDSLKEWIAGFTEGPMQFANISWSSINKSESDNSVNSVLLVIELPSDTGSLSVLKNIIDSYNLVVETASTLNQIDDLSISNYLTLDQLDCQNSTLKTETQVPLDHINLTASVMLLDTLDYPVTINKTRWALPLIKHRRFQSVSVCVSQIKPRNLVPDMKCSMIAYKSHEFEYDSSEGAIRIINTTTVYRGDEFTLYESKAFVCSDKVTSGRNTNLRFFEFSPVQRILSLVTSCISLLALLTIIVLHLIFSKLRNVHGLNLSALSSTMLLLQVGLLLENVSGLACTILAILLHFLLLKMFVWMNIIGVDMAMLFLSRTASSNHNPFKRFRRYLAIAMVVPALIVCLCIILEYTVSGFNLGYGQGYGCWIANPTAIIAFVTAPIGLSIVVNIVLFSITAYTINAAKKASKKATGNRAYCLVYFKMTVILGLTWLLGIVAAFVSLDGLWYVHIVLNGLQGLSIFVCFVLNARVMNTIRGRTKSSRRTKATTSTISLALSSSMSTPNSRAEPGGYSAHSVPSDRETDHTEVDDTAHKMMSNDTAIDQSATKNTANKMSRGTTIDQSAVDDNGFPKRNVAVIPPYLPEGPDSRDIEGDGKVVTDSNGTDLNSGQPMPASDGTMLP